LKTTAPATYTFRALAEIILNHLLPGIYHQSQSDKSDSLTTAASLQLNSQDDYNGSEICEEHFILAKPLPRLRPQAPIHTPSTQ